MHVGLIDGPFVPHNLISAQESPVPLPKFQMAPIHKILMSAGSRGELSYLAPLGSENISAPYFKQCLFPGGGISPPPRQSNTTPPSPKTEITNIFFYILNFASIIKFKM